MADGAGNSITSNGSGKQDGRVKILMLGESGVGKSSLLLRFTENKFSHDFVTTLGVEYKQKIVPIGDKRILVQVWDTAGQERFRTITPVYYRSVNGVIVTFDITERESFDSINYWMENMKQTTDVSKLTIVLVGNKSDLDQKRQVKREEGEELATKYNIQYYESSAKTSSNVNEIFAEVAAKIVEKNGIQLLETSNGNGGTGGVSLDKSGRTKTTSKGGGSGDGSCCSN